MASLGEKWLAAQNPHGRNRQTEENSKLTVQGFDCLLLVAQQWTPLILKTGLW
jgi:hypothetical protein